MSVFDFQTSIISRRRKGDSTDPFLQINENQQIVNSKVILSEIPEYANKVQIVGNDITWIETTSNNPSENQFYVDYNQGIVYHNSLNNGLTQLYSYMGTGSMYLNSSRIFTQIDSNGDITETLQDVVDNTKIIYKPPVTNFSDLDIIYSTPEIGWRVQVKSTNKIYRYNGDIWDYIEDASNITSIEVRSNNPTDDLFNGRMWLIN